MRKRETQTYKQKIPDVTERERKEWKKEKTEVSLISKLLETAEELD